MKSRCVSLTGATGFLGGAIVRAARARGWSVQAIVRPGNTRAVPDGARPIEADLGDASALARAFAAGDAVVHAAGRVRAAREHEFTSTNVDGTRAVVEAANAAGVRLVHISSLAAAGPAGLAAPAREDDAPRPVNAYGRSKLAGEDVVRDAARVPWLILRPSAVYGPGDRGFLPLARLANRGVFLLAAPAETAFTFVFVDDVAEAVAGAVDSTAQRDVLFVGHGRPETADAMLRAWADACGRPYRPVPVPRAVLRAASLAGDLVWRLGGTPDLDSSRFAEFTAGGFVCDVTRATERLGFTAGVALTDGIVRTVRWYRERGWL